MKTCSELPEDGYYHVRFVSGDRYLAFWNLGRDQAIQEYFIPFALGEVRHCRIRGMGTYVNFRAVSECNVYHTAGRIQRMGRELPKLFDRGGALLQNDLSSAFMSHYRTGKIGADFARYIIRSMSEAARHVFVGMSVNDSRTDGCFASLRKVFSDWGLDAYLVDQTYAPEVIADQICFGIASAHAVFIDLTGHRPNCYHEVGVAQGLGKNVILALHESEDDRDVHRNLSGIRLLRWKNGTHLAQQLEALRREKPQLALKPFGNGVQS